ncbi:hypothetical protein FOL47_006060 [Perkinsus chesapeaki]|uniref:Uncharacterized protein n=1 Tax=Perkinsus chesapeaki TaxID=330153 RepID=A0A7J6LU33_PERCH|nr:hypothetical protein FOL47_006060 [Perkinsus chesapeaki]
MTAPSSESSPVNSGAFKADDDKENKKMDVMAAVNKLFSRLEKEIEKEKPDNTIHFIVDMLCRSYPEHLNGFASLWNSDQHVQRERNDVVNFFRSNKISAQIAAHFINAGYDTVETLETLTPESLQDIEAFNDAKWLPGHKVRLIQLFTDIHDRVQQYKNDCTAHMLPYLARSPATVTSYPIPTQTLLTSSVMGGGGLGSSTPFPPYQSTLHQPPQTARYSRS